MSNLIASIKLAFKTKNFFCRLFVVLWGVFCSFMSFAFFAGTAGSMGGDDIAMILLLYYFASAAFLLPAVSIAQGVDATKSETPVMYSNKSWGLTLVLSVFFGHLGVHRFYAGRKATGTLYIFSIGGFGIGWLTDIILILVGKFTDKDGCFICRTKHISTHTHRSTGTQQLKQDAVPPALLLQANSVLPQEEKWQNTSDNMHHGVAESGTTISQSVDSQPVAEDLEKKKKAWENGGHEKLAKWRNEQQNPQLGRTAKDCSIFKEIVVPGNEERGQAIPERSAVTQVKQENAHSKLPASISSKSTSTQENAFSIDFEISYSGYEPYDKFIKDMKKYENKEGVQAPFVPFMQYWPTYDSMDRQQKAWYFYWRSEVRKNRYPDTDLSYIFVYVSEILSGCGWRTSAEGYSQLTTIWNAYRERFPKLDKYMFGWTFDFSKVNNVDHDVYEYPDLVLPAQSVMRDIMIDRHRDDKPLKLSFALINALCDYSITGSKFFKDGNQLLMHNAIPRVIALADAALLKNKGGGILAFYGPKAPEKQTYYAFRSAICPHAGEQISVSVRAYTSSQKLRNYINELVRYAENVLREMYGYRGRLRGVELDTETAALVRSFLRKEYSIKETAPAPEKKVEINLDLAAIEALRAESDAVRDALEVADEPAVASQLLTDLNEVSALIGLLSENARMLLCKLSSGNWAAEVLTVEKAQADEINRVAMQYLARELLVVENGFYIVEDDYRDEVEYVFKSDADMTNQSLAAPGNTVIEQNSMYGCFDTTRLPEALQSVVDSMSNLHQQVLWAIVVLSDPQDRINALADEEMTMPEILIDEINDIASQQLDDILIDTFNDTLCILEQYEQELKDAARAEVK